MPIELQLSTRELILNPVAGCLAGTEFRRTVRVCNPRNYPIGFTWTPVTGDRKSAFTIKPTKGMLCQYSVCMYLMCQQYEIRHNAINCTFRFLCIPKAVSGYSLGSQQHYLCMPCPECNAQSSSLLPHPPSSACVNVFLSTGCWHFKSGAARSYSIIRTGNFPKALNEAAKKLMKVE